MRPVHPALYVTSSPSSPATDLGDGKGCGFHTTQGQGYAMHVKPYVGISLSATVFLNGTPLCLAAPKCTENLH